MCGYMLRNELASIQYPLFGAEKFGRAPTGPGFLHVKARRRGQLLCSK